MIKRIVQKPVEGVKVDDSRSLGPKLYQKVLVDDIENELYYNEKKITKILIDAGIQRLIKKNLIIEINM